MIWALVGEAAHEVLCCVMLMLTQFVFPPLGITGKAASDIRTLLPIAFTLEDYSGTEKICYLPRKLDTRNEPGGMDPEVGYLAYYAPWGNLAVFYRDFRFSEGLILLGKLDSGSDRFAVAGSLKVTFEAAE